MKTTRRTVIPLATLAILILTAGLVLAQGSGRDGYRSGPGAGRHDGEPGSRWERLAERLELSEEQQVAIRELHEANRALNLGLEKQSRKLRHELEGELLADEPSEKKVLELSGELGDLRTEMDANRLKTRLAVRAQLTPEQRDKMLAAGAGLGRRSGRHGGYDGPGQRCGGRRGGFGHGRGPAGRDGCRLSDN